MAYTGDFSDVTKGDFAGFEQIEGQFQNRHDITDDRREGYFFFGGT